jgi:hypothetical protein
MCDKEKATREISPEDARSMGWTLAEPIYMCDFAVGCVVELREGNHYHDSDFYATYYDMDSGAFKEVEYGTTRFWSYPNGANIDATPEIMALWEAHLKAIRDAARAREAAYIASLPTVGKTVRVVSGRKLEKGIKGKIFWHGANGFKTYYRNGYNQPNPYERLGIELEDGTKVFTASKNCEVLA